MTEHRPIPVGKPLRAGCKAALGLRPGVAGRGPCRVGGHRGYNRSVNDNRLSGSDLGAYNVTLCPAVGRD